MREAIRREWRSLTAAVRRLDGQTVFVLLAAVVLVLLQVTVGSRALFRRVFDP